MPNEHAKISPSTAERWINCPRSVVLSAGMPDTAGECAAQGTEAHALAEYKVLKMVGITTSDPRPGMKYLDDEMEAATDEWADAVSGILEEAKAASPGAFCYAEMRLDLTRWIPGGFGTADAVIGSDGMLTIADLKYGAGVEVEAEYNPQLKIYGLGAIDALGALYDFDRVRLLIFQPLRGGFRNSEMPVAELLEWGDLVLQPAAEAADKGEGEYRPGDWCRFCKAKAVCRARAIENLKMARYDFAPPDKLEDVDIESILPLLDDLESWSSDIRAFALKMALDGKKWTGFKLVAGRSSRKYSSEEAVAAAVEAAGFDPYEKSIRNITSMQKMMGRKRFEELLGGLLVKPQGKPTLVPDTDRRPSFRRNAKTDFEE